ncbi:legumain-like [Orbicella faveolata]|uniref:legumain-like n=1 Tax=Orbicella faveolata TaxID=48498 RepID=UPI0009E40A8E|nr:legumain-like [Orbicella faveolata]
MLAELLFLGISLVAASEGKHWALVVAGSSGWYNYRHQADTCHAYQILHKNGIPDENIVVMMYDDIANNTQNPTPGVIINKPWGGNVYDGVLKDYTKEDVTPKNFLNILKGDKQAMSGIGSGKVIDSGPNDHVFVYFTDHGAPGLIAFPESELMANDLIDALNEMSEKKKFSRMVFYLEACESGSMFDKKLKDNINGMSAWVSVCKAPPYFFSITYVNDVDLQVDLNKESLLKQFQIVKQETNTSHVMQYGELDWDSEVLEDYQGEGSGKGSGISPEEYKGEPITDAVPVPDVHLKTLQNRLRDTASWEERQKIVHEIEELYELKEEIRKTMELIVEHCVSSDDQKMRVLKTKAEPQDFDCYKKAVKTFSKNCYNLGKNEHALRHVYALSNLCEENIEAEVIVSAIKEQCGEGKPDGLQF